jgi:hypothetical protein
MRVFARLLGTLAVAAATGECVAQDRPGSKTDSFPDAGGQIARVRSNPDAVAIGQLVDSFVSAFNAKNAKALGALFTRDAEIEDEDGQITLLSVSRGGNFPRISATG